MAGRLIYGLGVIGGLAVAAFEKNLDHLSHLQEMAVFRSLFRPPEGFGIRFLDAEPFCIIAVHIKHRGGAAEFRRFVVCGTDSTCRPIACRPIIVKMRAAD